MKAAPGAGHMQQAPPQQGGGAPVLLGRVVAGGAMLAPTPQVQYRVDPMAAQVGNLPLLQGIPVEKAERKVETIRGGAELALAQPAFPEARRCQDAFWIIPFFAVCVGVIGAALSSIKSVIAAAGAHDVSENMVGTVLMSGLLGGAASLVAASLLTCLARRAPSCVVWTSLLFSPVLMIMCGLAAFAASPVLGLILVLLGALSLSCIFCCYRSFIPFTIKVTEVVASIMEEHPGMFAVAVLGGVLGVAWSLACGFCFAGIYVAHKSSIDHASGGQGYAMYFAAFLVLYWGAQVVYNLCHVTYCGVFGRWYFSMAGGGRVSQSFRVAATTSFGSICLGALLVAAIRALEAVISIARRSAQEDGNPVCCVVLLLLECVVSCIGDLLEFFSEWAYVQCAVRGASFMQAAKITQSMLTCANLFYVIQALLINSVVNLGALLSGIVGCVAGLGVGLAVGAHDNALVGAVVGFWAGLVVGGATAGVLSSGAKTILALWAEDPTPLHRMRPAMHQDMENRIISAMVS